MRLIPIVLASLLVAAIVLGSDRAGSARGVALYGLLVAAGTLTALAAGKARRRLMARFPRADSGRGRAFAALFGVCCLLLAVWLLAGLAPYFAARSTGLHRALHDAGGPVQTQRVAVSNHDLDRELARAPDVLPHVDPARAEFDQAEITVEAGSTVRIMFDNRTVHAHNISIYADRDHRTRVFEGRVVPGHRRLEFDADGRRLSGRPEVPEPRAAELPVYDVLLPRAQTYWFRCDVYPTMTFGRSGEGRINALPHDGPAARSIERPGWSPRTLAYLVAAESHRAESGGAVAADYAFSLANAGLAIALFRLRPRDRVARLFSVGMLATAAAYNLQSHSAPEVFPLMADLHPGVIHPLAGLAYIYAVLTFPDGRLVPHWEDRRVRTAYAIGTFLAVVLLLDLVEVTRPAPEVGHAVNFLQFFGVLVPLVGFVAQGYRYRTAPSVEARQQSRLLLFALVPVFAVGAVLVALDAVVGLDETIVFRAFQPVFALIPAALLVGIARYRLWDIDLVVNKAILYGILAAFIGGVYVALVFGVGEAAPGANVLLHVVTLVVVAVAFEPVRRRAQQTANRLVFGERVPPYEVIADVSHRLAAAVAVEDALPRVAEMTARGLGAARVAVSVALPGGEAKTAVWPEGEPAGDDARTLDVRHDGAVIGSISVAKPPGEPLRPAEDRLLSALAGQTGAAFHSVRLEHELRARLQKISELARRIEESRGRIVEAQLEERRRLEAEIASAVGVRLRRMITALDEAESAIPRRRLKAVALLDAIADDAVEAQDRLRHIARGVFPPLLVDRGLLAAIESLVRKVDVPVRLTGRQALAGVRFDPDAEAAVYFCCAQVLRAARGGGEVRVSLDDEGNGIVFSIAHGGPPVVETAGIGDRIEALGGSIEVRFATEAGTTITGRVPADRRDPPKAGAGSPARVG